jgi:predicted RNA binding protein YcfA (HicA-like mRNA interferase family)
MSRRDKTVSYAELEALLTGLGFACLRAPGSHVYFEHAPSKVAVVVKDYTPHEEVPPYKLNAARETLHYFGLLDREEFEQALEDVYTTSQTG